MEPISKIPFYQIILYFLSYLIIHILIGLKKEKLKNEENKELYKKVNFLFNWFPVFYTIFIILILLL